MADRQAVGLGEIMGKFWLVTWTTYSSWLLGDPRGFRTFRGKEYVPPPARFARPGEPVYNPSDFSERYQQIKEQVPEAVRLNEEEKRVGQRAIVEEIDQLEMLPLIIAVGTTHVHLISQFGKLLIRPTVGRLKSAATRAIPNPGNRKRIWTKEFHMKSLENEGDFKQGLQYGKNHVSEGAIVYEWTENINNIGLPLPTQADRLAVGHLPTPKGSA